MKDLAVYCIGASATVGEAIKRLDDLTHKGGYPTLIVVNQSYRLIGTLNDGDIRRFLLNNKNLDASLVNATNLRPFTIGKNQTLEKNQIKNHKIIPVVDELGNLVDVVTLKKQKSGILANVSVVINAGGLGSRLLPYTNIVPKPLIPINNKAFIDYIINLFMRYGAKDFYTILNHKSSIIKSYLNEEWHELNIKTLEETKPLGTVGGLSLLKKYPINSDYIVLTNCDVLINSDFEDIIEYHKTQSNSITILSVEYEDVVPYGVLEVDATNNLLNIVEKPSRKYLVSSGIYIINYEEIKSLDESVPLDMNSFLDHKIIENKKIGVYNIAINDWYDIGTIDGLYRTKENLESNGFDFY